MANKKIVELIWTVLRTVKIVFVIILVFIGVICTIIVVPPLYVVRLFVSCLSFLRSDLDSIVEVSSTPFVSDDLYNKPMVTTINSSVYKGDINIEAFWKHVMERVINVKKCNGEMKSVKLTQYPYQWMGFMFWRWENHFDISEHVYYYDIPENSGGSKVSLKRLLEIESELLSKPFVKKKSPWECLIVRNVDCDLDEAHFMLMIRYHHSIGDGLSFVKNVTIPLSLNDGTKIDKYIASPTKIKRPGLQQFFHAFKMFVLLPYHIGKLTVEIAESRSWKNLNKTMENKYSLSMSEKISMKFLKEIKDIHNVGITAVIYSAFTACIRQAMTKQDGKVPEYMFCMLPFPMIGHPDYLTNHFSSVQLKLPVGEKDPNKRLRLIQENFDKLKISLIPIVPFYLSKIFGTLPLSLIRILLSFHTPTIAGSSFPGPKERYNILGWEAVDLHFSVGSCLGYSPVVLTSISYADDLRMKIAVNRGILDCKLDTDEIQMIIRKELLLLKKCDQMQSVV